MRFAIGTALFFIGVIVWGTGCGSSTKSGANVKLSFINLTPGATRNELPRLPELLASLMPSRFYIPSVMQFKIVDAYLVYNINADGTDDVSHGPRQYFYNTCGGSACFLSGSTQYIDLVNANATASSGVAGGINTVLGSQTYKVTPGTYEFFRFEICNVDDGNTTTPNITFQSAATDSDMTAPFSFNSNSCMFTSTDFSGMSTYPSTSTGLTLALNQNITLILSYDLSANGGVVDPGTQQTSDLAGSCDTTLGNPRCLLAPTFGLSYQSQ